ncbi:MAG TPA: DUF6069 family protein [Candidatus Thermoplasmatota archaeon]|nr:DUF6069 family protein [Candidatus Thermoplasmatota archaeon]
MSETLISKPLTRFPSVANLGRAALVTGLTALVAVAAVRLLAGALVEAPAGYEPFQWGALIAATLVGVVAATAAYAALTRFTRQGERNYLLLGYAFLAFSMVGPLLGPANNSPPGTTWPLAVVLVALHLAAGLPALHLMGRLAREA